MGTIQVTPTSISWVQAEMLAAAALLAERTSATRNTVSCSRNRGAIAGRTVDHKHGAWYRILTADNRKYSDEKSPAGKVDYHTMGACYDILRPVAKRHRWIMGHRRLRQRDFLDHLVQTSPFTSVACIIARHSGTMPTPRRSKRTRP